jgi:hypothetical protein
MTPAFDRSGGREEAVLPNEEAIGNATTTRHYAETTATTLKRKFDALTDPAARDVVGGIRRKLDDTRRGSELRIGTRQARVCWRLPLDSALSVQRACCVRRISQARASRLRRAFVTRAT